MWILFAFSLWFDTAPEVVSIHKTKIECIDEMLEQQDTHWYRQTSLECIYFETWRTE